MCRLLSTALVETLLKLVLNHDHRQLQLTFKLQGTNVSRLHPQFTEPLQQTVIRTMVSPYSILNFPTGFGVHAIFSHLRLDSTFLGSTVLRFLSLMAPYRTASPLPHRHMSMSPSTPVSLSVQPAPKIVPLRQVRGQVPREMPTSTRWRCTA